MPRFLTDLVASGGASSIDSTKKIKEVQHITSCLLDDSQTFRCMGAEGLSLLEATVQLVSPAGRHSAFPPWNLMDTDLESGLGVFDLPPCDRLAQAHLGGG